MKNRVPNSLAYLNSLGAISTSVAQGLAAELL